MTPSEILALPMQENDAGAATVADYLKALLQELWRRGEGFSGKRPFGNSGWEHELYRALIVGGAVTGTLDADGYVETMDDADADAAILDAIDALGVPA